MIEYERRHGVAYRVDPDSSVLGFRLDFKDV